MHQNDEFDDFLFKAESLENVEGGSSPAETFLALIVDNDESVHDATKLCFECMLIHGRKIVCMSAYSGQDACRILDNTSSIDFVLLDIEMETSSAGFEVARHLKNSPRTHKPVVIMRTKYASLGTAENLVSYQFNSCMNKLDSSSCAFRKALEELLPG